jgi:phage terminase Nu1 subunit (DNA packaging protein)
MRQAEEDAKVTEMERRQKEGELVATADVMSMWTRIATGLKNDLLNIGAQARQKCAPLLRDPVDAGKVQDAVDEAVRRALEKAIEHGETA